MLSELFQRLRASDPNPDPDLPEPDAELALGALLVRVALSDKDYKAQEIGLIDRILARQFQHSPIEAAKIRAVCEKLNAAAPDTDHFASLIRDTTGIESRLAALDALWEVVLADGTQQAAELGIIEDARIAMGLSELDSQTARARAETRT